MNSRIVWAIVLIASVVTFANLSFSAGKAARTETEGVFAGLRPGDMVSYGVAQNGSATFGLVTKGSGGYRVREVNRDCITLEFNGDAWRIPASAVQKVITPL